MPPSPFVVTSTAPLALKPGEEGRTWFAVSSLAAPDRIHQVVFEALLVGSDGEGRKVDWLIAGPQGLSISGGKTETVTVTARPTPLSPGGTNTIQLRVVAQDSPYEVYADSPTVPCEVITPPEVAPPLAVARIPAIAVAGLLLLSSVVFIVWRLWCQEPSSQGSGSQGSGSQGSGSQEPAPQRLPGFGETCGRDPVYACGTGLLCVAAVQKCLRAGGARCKPALPNECASGECGARTEVCAIPFGGACTPGDTELAPCPGLGICDPTTKACVENRCKAGAQQCNLKGNGIDICDNNGSWMTDLCPTNTPQCLDGRCQCVAGKGRDCNCGGKIQCDGTCSVPVCNGACTNGRCCPSGDPACGSTNPIARLPEFNEYVLRAIDLLYDKYRDRGYRIDSAFTHDLDYAVPREIKAGPYPPKTMCVAAVSEVIIVALKIYADEKPDPSIFTTLPARSWMGSRPTDIRSYMFMYEGVDSNGTADALEHFGIGVHTPFSALRPGDFIGLNRTNGTGHAVVFLGYLDASGKEIPFDAAKVAGFKYFSAQTGGLGYRWAFFHQCPSWSEANKPRDCGIIRSDQQDILNAGYMLHPKVWTTKRAMDDLKTKLTEAEKRRLLSRRVEPRQLEELANEQLLKDLPPVSRLKFDGVTTDD
jgi:hypothetical protein